MYLLLLLQVKENEEPLEFSCHFHGWDAENHSVKELGALERVDVEVIGIIETKEETEELDEEDKSRLTFSYDR